MANNSSDRPTYLSQVLTHYRTVNKLSQAEVAEHLGITRSAYAYYEIGRTEPSNDNLRLLAKLYSAPIEDFVPPDKEAGVNLADSASKLFGGDDTAPARMGELSSTERKLIALFRLANTGQKRSIVEIIQKVLLKKN